MEERLTKRIDNKTYFIIKTEGNDFYSDGEDLTFNYYDKEVQKTLDRLADYEDLEEQGLIVRLRCKVGDVLYRVDIGGNVVQGEVGMLQCLKDGRWKFRFIYKLRSYSSKSSYDEYCDKIGKTYFLTYEEVEKKLEELNGK